MNTAILVPRLTLHNRATARFNIFADKNQAGIFIRPLANALCSTANEFWQILVLNVGKTTIRIMHRNRARRKRPHLEGLVRRCSAYNFRMHISPCQLYWAKSVCACLSFNPCKTSILPNWRVYGGRLFRLRRARTEYPIFELYRPHLCKSVILFASIWKAHFKPNSDLALPALAIQYGMIGLNLTSRTPGRLARGVDVHTGGLDGGIRQSIILTLPSVPAVAIRLYGACGDQWPLLSGYGPNYNDFHKALFNPID